MMLLVCPSFSTATHQTKDKNQYRLFPWMLLQGGTWLLGFGHHWSYSCWSSSAGTRTSQNEELFQTARKYQPPVSVYDFSFCCCCSLQSTDLLLCGQAPLNQLPCPLARKCTFSWPSSFGSMWVLHGQLTAGLNTFLVSCKCSHWGDVLPQKM